MKKIICKRFPEVFGIRAFKRFVYDETPGQAEAERITGMEVGREAEISGNTEGEAGINKAFDKAKADIDSKAAEFKGKYEGKEDADKAKAAIETARVAAQGKLEKAKTAALAVLKQNADKDANDMAKVLVDSRKSEAEKKYKDPLGYQSVPGDAGFDWINEKGKKEWNHLGTDDFKVALTAMIQAVYVAEGKKAADDLVAKMKNSKLGFLEMKYDDEFKFAQGVEHDPPLIQFNPDYDNDERGNTRKLTGLIFGYAHAARNRLEDDTAREAYLAYLAESGKKAGSAPRSMSPDDILTPDQWIAAPGNEKYIGAGKKLDEQKLNEERASQVDDYLSKLSNTKEREELKGIILGRLQGEKDPKKWMDIIRDTSAKAFGMSLDEYGKTEWADLDKSKLSNINDFVKKSQESMGKYVLDEGQNRDGKCRGYVAGLLMKAEERFKDDPAMLAQYKEQLKTITGSDELRQKMGDNLANSEYYTKRLGETGNLYEDKRPLAKKLEDANNALFDVVKNELPSPDKFADAAKAEKDKKYNSMGETYRNQERYADDMIAKIPADKVKERNYIRSILIAAVGRETDPAKIKALGEAALKDAKGLNLDPANLGSVDYEKNLKAFVDAHQDLTENGNKMDDQSKGLAAGLLYAAELKYQNDPNKDKILAGYKEYLKGKMDTLGKDSGTVEKIEKLKRKQDLLEDTTDPATRKKILGDIDKLQTELYNKSWYEMAWPDTFKKTFEEGEGKKHEELMAGNKDFLDKYGTKEKTDNFSHANPQIDAIFEAFKNDPKNKDVYDKNKAAIEAKKTELHKLMASTNKDPSKGPVILTPEARLGVMAQAQDYLAHLADDKASEKRYKEAADRYTVTVKILAASADKKKSADYVTAMAKGIGYETAEGKVDPKVQAALDKVNAAKDEDRAGVIAEQFGLLFKDAPSATDPNFTLFTKSDFDDYSKYLADKPKEEEPKKKTSVGGGTPGGGAPQGGSQGSPSAVPGGNKEKPDTKPGEKEKIDTPALSALLKKAVADVIAMFKGKEMTKSPADTAKDILGGIMGAILGPASKYDLNLNKGATFTDENGITVTVQSADKIDTNASEIITAAWVEKNMKVKEKIKDPTEAANKMSAVVHSVVDKYAKMDYAGMQAAGITDQYKLNQAIVGEIAAAFPGQNIDSSISFKTPAYKGYYFTSEGGPHVDATGVNGWDKRLFEGKKRDAELGADKPKLDAISSYMNRLGWNYLVENVNNGTFKTLAQFNGGVNSAFAAATAKYQLKDGSYDVYVMGNGFKINYSGGKFTGASGDYAGLVASVQSSNPDRPRLA